MARKVNGMDWLAGVIDRGCKRMPCLSRMAVRGGVGATTDLEVCAQSEVARPDGVYRRIGREWVADSAVPFEEMPSVPVLPITAKRVELPAGATGLLVQGMPFVEAAASTDESRRVLNHLLLEVKAGAARLVATDGKRLHVVELGEVKGEDCNLLLSRKFCKLLMRMLSGISAPIDFVQDGERVEVSANGMRLTLRMCYGVYPNWRAVYTDYERARVGYEYAIGEGARSAAVDWNKLANAAELDKEGRYLITFGVAPRLSIVTHNVGLKREAELGAAVHGGPGEIILRADYVADIMRDWPGEGVTLRTGPDSCCPVEFSAPGVMAVLMPMRNNRIGQAGQSFKRKADTVPVVGYGVSDCGDRNGGADESAEYGLCSTGGRPLSYAEAKDIKDTIGEDAAVIAFFEAGEPQPISAEG